MRRVVMGILVALGALLSSSAHGDGDGYITLAVEERTILRVDQFAMLLIPSDYRYSINTAGRVLVVVQRRADRVVYRAVRPGLETIVLSPDVPNGDCISCQTHHHFITVVSRNANPQVRRPQ
jgi:hypothetical protein